MPYDYKYEGNYLELGFNNSLNITEILTDTDLRTFTQIKQINDNKEQNKPDNEINAYLKTQLNDTYTYCINLNDETISKQVDLELYEERQPIKGVPDHNKLVQKVLDAKRILKSKRLLHKLIFSLIERRKYLIDTMIYDGRQLKRMLVFSDRHALTYEQFNVLIDLHKKIDTIGNAKSEIIEHIGNMSSNDRDFIKRLDFAYYYLINKLYITKDGGIGAEYGTEYFSTAELIKEYNDATKYIIEYITTKPVKGQLKRETILELLHQINLYTNIAVLKKCLDIYNSSLPKPAGGDTGKRFVKNPIMNKVNKRKSRRKSRKNKRQRQTRGRRRTCVKTPERRIRKGG
jgi:hypothetical protein